MLINLQHGSGAPPYQLSLGEPGYDHFGNHLWMGTMSGNRVLNSGIAAGLVSGDLPAILAPYAVSGSPVFLQSGSLPAILSAYQLSGNFLTSGSVNITANSGNIASGSIGENHLASGVLVKTYGTTFLPSSYTVVSGDYAATGLSVTLPGAGTYKIEGQLQSTTRTTDLAGGFIRYILHNNTAGAAVSGSEFATPFGGQANVVYVETSKFSHIVSATSGHTIQVRAVLANGPTYDLASVDSNANSRSKMMFVRLGP